jgi:hypothetical protein
MMQALAGSAAFWILLIVTLCLLYLLPTLIAVVRGTDRLALVFVVNVIGGTAGIGWLAAMILACGPRRLPPVPPMTWPPPSPPAPWSPPQEPAEDRAVVMMRADAGEPDYFGRGSASSRSDRSRRTAAR